MSAYMPSPAKRTRRTRFGNKIAVKLHYNCEPDDLQRKIADYAVRCYKALGFSCSLGHLEILLKPDGTLSPVEIGARSSGCIASDLVDIVSGRDFLKDWFDVLNGGSVPDGLRPQSLRSSMFFFYDLPAGARIVRRCNLLDFTDEAVSSRFWDRSRIDGRLSGAVDRAATMSGSAMKFWKVPSR